MLAYAGKDWETAADAAERAQFMRMIRKRHMKSFMEQMSEGDDRVAPSPRLASSDCVTGSARVAPSPEPASTGNLSASLSDSRSLDNDAGSDDNDENQRSNNDERFLIFKKH